MKTRFGGEKPAEIGLVGRHWDHEVKNRSRGAAKAEGMVAFFNTLLMKLFSNGNSSGSFTWR